MKDISAQQFIRCIPKGISGERCASSWRMKAISLFYSIDTDTMYHHAPGLPPGDPRGRKGTMGARRMPWHRKSTKGAASRDRPGEAQTALDPGFPNGEPAAVMGGYPIGDHPFGGTTGELKHLSTPRREINRDRASSGERKRASPNLRRRQGWGRCLAGVAGRRARAPGPGRSYKTTFERNGMGRPAAAGESPVREGRGLRSAIQSRAGHVKPGPKQGTTLKG